MFARRQFRWKRWLPSFVDCTQKAHKEENRRLVRRLSDLQSKFRLVMASSATTSATATSVSTTSAAADRTAAAAVEAASTSTTMESATAGSAVESTAGGAAVESAAGRAAVKGCARTVEATVRAECRMVPEGAAALKCSRIGSAHVVKR